MAHAFASPSGFSQAKKCPASALRQFQIAQLEDFMYEAGADLFGLKTDAEKYRWKSTFNREERDKYANDGTALHAVFEQGVKDGIHAPEDIRQLIEERNTVQVLHEDDFIVDRLSASIKEHLDLLETADRVGLEHRVKILGLPQWGTMDLYWAEGRTLHVNDLKAGQLHVESAENDQLMNYAVGLLDKLGWYNYDDVVMRIIGLHFTAEPWTCSVDDLRAYKRDVMIPVMLEVFSLNPRAEAGDQCTHCSAKPACPEWWAKFKDQADAGLFEPQLEELSTSDLEERYFLCAQAEKCKKEYGQRLLQAFNGFDEPTRVILANGKRSTYYADEDEAKKVIHKLLGKKAFDIKLKSASTVQKMLGDNTPDGLIITRTGNPYVRMK